MQQLWPVYWNVSRLPMIPASEKLAQKVHPWVFLTALLTCTEITINISCCLAYNFLKRNSSYKIMKDTIKKASKHISRDLLVYIIKSQIPESLYNLTFIKIFTHSYFLKKGFQYLKLDGGIPVALWLTCDTVTSAFELHTRYIYCRTNFLENRINSLGYHLLYVK